jgi:hypothetical protein
MTRFLIGGVLSCVCLLAAVQPVAGQEISEAGWHHFHDKDGNEIEARTVALSPDLRSVQILRRDGRIFDLAVTRLSLDDQQHLREWFLAQSPADPARLRFEITINRREKLLKREKLVTPIREALWETTELSYEVSITSLSTEPIPGLRLEYALLMEDHIKVRVPVNAADEDPADASPRWRSAPEGEIRYRRGTIDLPPLTFNRPIAADVGALVLDSVKTSHLERAESRDQPGGLILRLVDSGGNVVHEQIDLARQFTGTKWSNLANRWDPEEESGEGVLVNPVAAN